MSTSTKLQLRVMFNVQHRLLHAPNVLSLLACIVLHHSFLFMRLCAGMLQWENNRLEIFTFQVFMRALKPLFTGFSERVRRGRAGICWNRVQFRG